MVSRRVMVVDDVPTERAMVAGLLRQAGHEVSEAASAVEALGLVRSGSAQPEAILMDVVMLPMNGFEACRTLSRDPATRHIAVLMCTSKDGRADRDWARRQGAVGYIVKPVLPAHAADVLAKLERALSRKKAALNAAALAEGEVNAS